MRKLIELFDTGVVKDSKVKEFILSHIDWGKTTDSNLVLLDSYESDKELFVKEISDGA